MYLDYRKGMSFAELARRYGKARASIREVFRRRGLEVAPPKHSPAARLENGSFAPAISLSRAQIDELVENATSLAVPVELKLEWRKWSMLRRAQFIKRLREKLKSPKERPNTPFSKGVQPFDYTTPRAQEICRRMNAGRDSRSALIKLNISSQGVIWNGQLWFWSHKVGYQAGPWTAEEGRPCLHRVIWERHHKRNIPKDGVISFRDGNRNNFHSSNLVVQTRNDLCRMNQAAALQKRSRELTGILLTRTQENNHETTHTIQSLRRRHTKSFQI